jgi:hypothetical protein
MKQTKWQALTSKFIVVTNIFFHDSQLEGVAALRNIINLEGKFVGPCRFLSATLGSAGFSLCGTLEIYCDEWIHLSKKL